MPGIKRDRNGSVGVLTLDEPETLNAMTPDLLGALATAIHETTADPELRALVLTGAGRGFCSGQNLKAFNSLGDDVAAGVMRHWPAFQALRECRVPVVVAVNGVAPGGGFSHAKADRRERARELRRAVQTQDRRSIRRPSQQRRARGPQGISGEASGTIYRALIGLRQAV